MFTAGQNCGVLLLGGETGPPPTGIGLGDLWTYRQPGGWGRLSAEPSTIFGPALFDLALHRLIVLGVFGPNFQPTQEDLNYDSAANRWQVTNQPGRPSNILGAQIAYSSKSDRGVLFGGVDLNTGDLNSDTWTYDPRADTWTKQAPVVSPPARNFGAMVYDEKADKFVLFGGGGASGGLGDTWMYDYGTNTWTNKKPANSPAPRVYQSIVYEPNTNRVILFGGVKEETANEASNSQTPFGDTWSYDPDTNTWKELSPAVSPSARGWHALAYDADIGKILLFGGGVSRGQPTNDLWQFDPTSDTWTRT